MRGTDQRRAAVRQLQQVLGDRVCPPGSAGYAAALDRVFFPDAARRQPACVVAPASASEVSSVMRIAEATGASVTVRGGGLSSNCVADGAIMLDLSVHLDHAVADGDVVVAGGGATVGTMMDALAGTGRRVPAGIVRLAGLGLVTRGGVGFLTRSLGLTLDQLVSAELVLASGEVLRLSADSAGAEAELWWAVQGCAPSLGVVTGVTLRTHPAAPVFVDRMVVAPEALPAYFELAPGLPRHTSMSAVLAPVPGDSGRPGLLVYTVCASGSPADVDAARQAATAVAASAGSPALLRREQTEVFAAGFPEMALPLPDGREPPPVSVPPPGQRSGFFYGKSVFLDASPGAGGAGAALADALCERLRAAPTPACRIDLQHTGGALADVGDTDTAFWGRGAEWNAPVNAMSTDDGQREECVAWARDTMAAFAPHTIGVYSVELRPGFAETKREVAAAYGDNLARLRRLARSCDPDGVLDRYAPLGG